MNKLEKPIKGKNLITIVEAFFKKVIKKLNQVHSQEYIESELADNISANAKYIRVNNGQHIETFLKQLIDEGIGNANSYVGLKVEVVKNDKIYSGIVEIVQINTTNIILRPKEAFGEFIQMPATVRLYVAPLFTSNSESSIVYNSIVTSKSKYNFILGERNIHKGEDNVWIFGKNNVSRESNHNSLIDGYNNDVDSYGNLVIGDNNKHRSYYGATIGQKIKNFKKYSYLFGEGHDNGNGSQYGTAFGKYSKLEADTLFAIGDGVNENNRHNLFELKQNGAILDKDGNDIRNSGGTQVQSDWNENDNAKPSYIKNKPTIPTPVAQQQSDWNESNGNKPSFIKNKPTIPDAQVQADWNETDSTKKSFIKNKPNINSPITEITWAVLKDLKDNRDLIPGMQYRITDYITTTVQENTRSAGNQFDIIVIADDKNKLNENARACLHQGDSYFATNKLEAWKLKYCLDNDNNRFAWVDINNGKGVIYWMKDEYDNECPYDFKNIQFKRYKILECPKSPGVIGKYALPFINNNNVIVDEEDFKYFYTFTNNILSMKDTTMTEYNKINNASILPLMRGRSRRLNDNVFIGDRFRYIKLNKACCENTIANVEFIKFDYDCYRNIIGYGLYANNATNSDKIIFGNHCGDNWIGGSCICNFKLATNNFVVGGSEITFGFHCSSINVLVPYVEGLVVGSFNNNINITSERTIDSDNRLCNIIITSRVNYGVSSYKTISHNIVNNNLQTIYKPVGSQEIEI